jgi:Fe-S-cluster containining protein
MNDEYRALVAKVDAFADATSARRRADMACRSGCASCCHAWLTVSPVEAAALREAVAELPPSERAPLAARGRLEREREARGEAQPRCAMLDEADRCGVYAARPLVCRSQGHALLYPPGFIPEAAVRARVEAREQNTEAREHSSAGEVTYCPLNYQAAPPGAQDVLDAGRVDQLLALVNHRFARAQGEAPDRRTSISQIAAEADMLGCSKSPG